MNVEVSEIIDRPITTVFRFYAHEHVRNHPRWDPDMELEQVSSGPIGVGTVIRRRRTSFDPPVEGTMEVVEFEEDRSMAVVIHDGPNETRGRATLESLATGETRLVMSVEMPWLDESGDPEMIMGLMRRSTTNIKTLIESET